jgi:hypothetical protein
MTSLQPSSAPPIFTRIQTQPLHPIAVGVDLEGMAGNAGPSSDATMETLTATSPSISTSVSTDFSTSLTVMKKPYVENHVPLAALQKPNNTTLKPKCFEVKRVSSSGTIACEFPGCTIKFSCKKDRNRHFRLKQQANEGYRCPFLHCSMGTGHRIQRRDKLREHLRRKGEESSPWQCILPGCLAVTRDRATLIDHLSQHDCIVRLAHQQLLIDYSFITGNLHPEAIMTSLRLDT